MTVFALALQLFAAPMGVSLAVETCPIDAYWQLSTDVGSFQNAWDAIGQRGIYYLRLGTGDLRYRCVITTITATSSRDKIIDYKSVMYNVSPQEKKEFEGRASVREDVRGIYSNIYRMARETGEGDTLISRVVYTEKAKCYVMYKVETEDFELWVRQTESDFLPRGCEYVYRLVTYNLKTNIFTDKSFCKDVVKETEVFNSHLLFMGFILYDCLTKGKK
uniref:Putative salivary lipocalin n=1 Tax=Ixodes ricinus TaxID=34613 RepID=A0A0K8R9T9_IXORI